MKEDLTKMRRERSIKILSKEEVREKYPGFKDENVAFYLNILTEYMRTSLGMVTKE